jgi:hypothetical protein
VTLQDARCEMLLCTKKKESEDMFHTDPTSALRHDLSFNLLVHSLRFLKAIMILLALFS